MLRIMNMSRFGICQGSKCITSKLVLQQAKLIFEMELFLTMVFLLKLILGTCNFD